MIVVCNRCGVLVTLVVFKVPDGDPRRVRGTSKCYPCEHVAGTTARYR